MTRNRTYINCFQLVNWGICGSRFRSQDMFCSFNAKVLAMFLWGGMLVFLEFMHNICYLHIVSRNSEYLCLLMLYAYCLSKSRVLMRSLMSHPTIGSKTNMNKTNPECVNCKISFLQKKNVLMF